MTNLENDIIEEFKNLNKIPRKSNHEEKVSEYLYNRCIELGLDTVRDEVNNVIGEKSAEEGYENVPTLILQAHMDMVCDSKEPFDFINTPIKTIVDEDKNVIYADGTTLGADDGIGVVVILELIKEKVIKSKVRVIFTTDEETSMTGANNIDAKYAEGKYFINVDWEDSNSICVSSAGARDIAIKRDAKTEKNLNEHTYEIEVKDLPGGHSGTEIHLNIPNAILEINKVLKCLTEKKINFNIVDFYGGTASNAITISSRVRITTNITETELKNVMCEVDNNVKYEIKEIERVNECLDLESTLDIVKILDEIPNGVYTMSKEIKDFVITSSNIGIITCNESEIKLECLLRSSVKELMEEMYDKFIAVVDRNNGKIFKDMDAPSWPYEPNSKLLTFAKEAYDELEDGNVKIEPVHAGLECGYFIMKNAKLEAISIGPTVEGAHTVGEKVVISELDKSYNIIKRIIEKICKN